MSIINEIQKELNLTLTENEDTGYKSTLSANLDFFGIAGASRFNQEQVKLLFKEAYKEDCNLALKNMLYLRDIRSGLGERESFRTCLKYLAAIYKDDLSSSESKERFYAFLDLIVCYGRYDDLLCFLDETSSEKLAKATSDYIFETLKSDLENVNKNPNANITLCAKWLPSINASSYKTRKYALKLIELSKLDKKTYRLILSKLRSHLNIIEKSLTNKDFTFDYEKIPAKALSKYVSCFRNNDYERFESYKESLKNGENIAKTRTLFPHEIINMIDKDEDLAEAQWKALERPKDSGNTIVVRDGSGSMVGLPLAVATSLAILYSELLKGEFKNKFITFSDKPELVDLTGIDSLTEKVYECKKYDDWKNTNLSAVYELIFRASLSVKDPKEYITRMVIISDQEFDAGVDKVPTFETMEKKFNDASIPLPEVVFWNVNARNIHFAAKPDQPNIKLVSGISNNIIEQIINNESMNAKEFMLQVLNKYNAIDEILK